MTDQPSNRVILAELLTLSVARYKMLVGMDTEGVAYRVRPHANLIGRWEVSQRAVNELGWKVPTQDKQHLTGSEIIHLLLEKSVPITGWHLVERG